MEEICIPNNVFLNCTLIKGIKYFLCIILLLINEGYVV